MEVRVDLPSDIDIQSFIATVPGASIGRGWDKDKGAWFIQAPSQAAVTAAISKFDVAADRLRQLRPARLAQLADRRWQAEVAGTVALGCKVSTSRESQAMIANAQAAWSTCSDRKWLKLDFKTLDGWVQVSSEQMKQICDAVVDHVQLCFSRERELAAQINGAQDLSALLSINIDTGWPD